MSNIRPMFPPVIDASLMAAWRACHMQAFRTYFEHWKPQEESVHLVAGGAFARGLEIARRRFYEDGMTQEEAIGQGLGALIAKYGDFECPSDSAKSLERTCGAFEFYFDNYPMATDQLKPIMFGDPVRSGVEFSFAQPLPVCHPVTGDPLIYSGRTDMLAEGMGGVYIEDDKTTSSLGPSWAKQWDLRSQFTGYAWAAREIKIKVSGVVVRGVSILKTKYDTQQAITYRPDWEIERWLEQTVRDLQMMIRCWEEGYFDYDLNESCSSYGGCKFTQVCKSKDPEPWLNTYFTKRVWNPLLHAEQTVEEWEALWPEAKEQELVVRTYGEI
jgi:hypothetical protein